MWDTRGELYYHIGEYEKSIKDMDKAIKKGTGNLDNVTYEEASYEGYGPNGVAILVETMTDNRNRTVADVRHAFSKFGGNMGTDGSVAYLFNKLGIVHVALSHEEDQIMEIALDAGADDFSVSEDFFEIVTTPSNLSLVAEALKKNEIETILAEITMRAETLVDLDQEASEKVYEYLNQVIEHLKAIKEDRHDLEELHIRIFGVSATEDQPKKEGLKGEIETGLGELKRYDEEQKTKHSALTEEIESLLPGATSAGLATAFKEMKDSFDTPISKYTRMFYNSLVLIIFLSVIAMIESVGSHGISFIKYVDLGQFANSLGWKVPVVGAAVWLAVFASKRRSEAQRLQQEYAHKESVAKSYNGFKKQIEELVSDDKGMLLSLISKTVDSVSENASKTLDGKHGDKSPLHELTEKVLPDIEKLKKVFGS